MVGSVAVVETAMVLDIRLNPECINHRHFNLEI
jgi:hypothetical protein